MSQQNFNMEKFIFHYCFLAAFHKEYKEKSEL